MSNAEKEIVNVVSEMEEKVNASPDDIVLDGFASTTNIFETKESKEASDDNSSERVSHDSADLEWKFEGGDGIRWYHFGKRFMNFVEGRNEILGFQVHAAFGDSISYFLGTDFERRSHLEEIRTLQNLRQSRIIIALITLFLVVAAGIDWSSGATGWAFGYMLAVRFIAMIPPGISLVVFLRTRLYVHNFHEAIVLTAGVIALGQHWINSIFALYVPGSTGYSWARLVYVWIYMVILPLRTGYSIRLFLFFLFSFNAFFIPIGVYGARKIFLFNVVQLAAFAGGLVGCVVRDQSERRLISLVFKSFLPLVGHLPSRGMGTIGRSRKLTMTSINGANGASRNSPKNGNNSNINNESKEEEDVVRWEDVLPPVWGAASLPEYKTMHVPVKQSNLMGIWIKRFAEDSFPKLNKKDPSASGLAQEIVQILAASGSALEYTARARAAATAAQLEQPHAVNIIEESKSELEQWFAGGMSSLEFARKEARSELEVHILTQILQALNERIKGFFPHFLDSGLEKSFRKFYANGRRLRLRLLAFLTLCAESVMGVQLYKESERVKRIQPIRERVKSTENTDKALQEALLVWPEGALQYMLIWRYALGVVGLAVFIGLTFLPPRQFEKIYTYAIMLLSVTIQVLTVLMMITVGISNWDPISGGDPLVKTYAADVYGGQLLRGFMQITTSINLAFFDTTVAVISSFATSFIIIYLNTQYMGSGYSLQLPLFSVTIVLIGLWRTRVSEMIARQAYLLREILLFAELRGVAGLMVGTELSDLKSCSAEVGGKEEKRI